MRVCSSAIFVSLTSTGDSVTAAGGAAFNGLGVLLLPVSHMMRTMSNARLASSHDCTFFGSNPGGFGAFSWTWAVSVMDRPSVRRRAARERQFLPADSEVTGVDDFRRDVDAVIKLKVDEVGFAVLDFIQRRFFSRRALDVGELVIVIHRGNEEWFSRRLGVESVIKLKLRRVGGTKAIDLFGGLSLGGADLLSGLYAECVEFFLVCLGLTSFHVAAQ